MAAARESGKEPPEGEAGADEPGTRKRKKARVAVSIRKGNLLFFPTALPPASDRIAKPEGLDPEDEAEET